MGSDHEHSLEWSALDLGVRERAQLGADLHDTVCQELTAATFLAAQLEKALRRESASETSVDRVARLSALLRRAAKQARELARGLYPLSDSPESLSYALEALAQHTSALSGLTCRFTEVGVPAIENAHVATQLLMIAREAVHNAVKHSGATLVDIRLRADPRGLHLSVSDDGNGMPEPSLRKAGLGLGIIHQRAKSIGAEIAITGVAPTGTRISCDRTPGAAES